MSGVQVLPPFQVFPDVDGDPLEDGYIYIGQKSLDPETNPIQAYWDYGLSIPAIQPIRTKGGYASNGGSPSNIFVRINEFSMRTKNKNGTVVSTNLSAKSPDANSAESGSPQIPGTGDASNSGLFFYPATLSGPGGNNIGVQSFAFNEVNRSAYTLQLNGAGSGNLSTVNRFSLDGTITQSSLGFSTPVSSDVGHQGLSVEYLDGTNFRLWTTGYADPRQVVRYSYADGAPLGDIQLYTLFGSDFASNTSCTPTISYGQSFLIAQGTKIGATNTTIRVWRLSDLVNGGPGDYSSAWLHQWDTQGLVDADHPTQGIASDGVSVWIVAGNQSVVIGKRFQMYTIAGDLVSSNDDFQVGKAQALLDGSGLVYEPEGLAIVRSGPSLVLCVGVISGDLGTRFSRVYALGLREAVHSSKYFADGNIRSSMSAMTDSGRQGLQIRGALDGSLGAGIDLYGASDSTRANQIGLLAGGVDALVGVITRTSGNMNIESLTGELRLNSLTGTAIRLQDAGTTKMATNASGVRFYDHSAPISTATYTSGTTALRYSDAFANQYTIGTGNVRQFSGVGTPEGAVTAVVGSTFQRSDGGALTSFYVKETGAGNTGWVAK